MEVIAAIVLLCSGTECQTYFMEPRFENIEACQAYLKNHRLEEQLNGNLVVLDDCIITTEERIRELQDERNTSDHI